MKVTTEKVSISYPFGWAKKVEIPLQNLEKIQIKQDESSQTAQVFSKDQEKPIYEFSNSDYMNYEELLEFFKNQLKIPILREKDKE